MKKRPHKLLLGGRQYSVVSSLFLATPFLALSLLVFVLPLATLLSESLFSPHFTLEHYQRAIGEPVYMRVMFRTLRIALYVTALTLLLAWPLAWVMSRSRGLRLALLLAAVLMPLWTSVLVRTYAWVVMLQRNGVVNNLLEASGIIHAPLRLLYTEVAVVIAMAHVLLPFMVLPIYAALRGIPEDYIRAAQMMGATAWPTFREIVLPLSAPGITSGCLMVFLLAVGFFVTPSLVGGPQQMMISTLVSQQVREMLNWPFAGALVGILLVFVILLALLFKRSIRLDRFVGAS